jgi:hypothetical protein
VTKRCKKFLSRKRGTKDVSTGAILDILISLGCGDGGMTLLQKNGSFCWRKIESF